MKHVTIVDCKWSVPNWVLQDIHEALTELAARRLSARKNHLRVVTLIRQWFADPIENIKDVINTAVDDNPAPEGWESVDLPVAVNEARSKEVLKIKRECQLIEPIPTSALLTDDDLPKTGIKDAIGDRNQFGIGDIIRKLHFVYPMPCDKDEPASTDGDSAIVEE